MTYLDIEAAVMDRVADLGDVVSRTGTDIKERVAASGAVIRVHRTGGRDLHWQVSARLTVEVYAATRVKAWDVAEDVAVRLLTRGGFRVDSVLVDQVVSESANAEIPYTDPVLRLVQGGYRVTARRTALQLTS